MTLTTQVCDQATMELCVDGVRSQAKQSPRRILWGCRLNPLPAERPTVRRIMSKRELTLRPRAGFSSKASGSSLLPNQEPGVEVARQRFIKAYLRRPLLEQVELGEHQPASLAEALDRAECMLGSIKSVAA